MISNLIFPEIAFPYHVRYFSRQLTVIGLVEYRDTYDSYTGKPVSRKFTVLFIHPGVIRSRQPKKILIRLPTDTASLYVLVAIRLGIYRYDIVIGKSNDVI